jgi:hypothetical protein
MQSDKAVRPRCIQRAAELLGGYDQLAMRLQVKLDHLLQWVNGFEPTPNRVFLAVVDIIIDHQIDQAISRQRLV